MVEIGLFPPEARLELIEGEILTMASQTSYHAVAVSKVQASLMKIFRANYYIRVQMPLALSDNSEPEPDLAVVVGTADDYWNAHPQRAELIVEVAYSSLDHDKQRKRRLYARNWIPEYWILNLHERQLEVYLEPQGDDFQLKTVLSTGATVAPLLYPNNFVNITDLLPR